jgi:hypothetical protein|tara:strand:+ start:562 stop:765 length:204 start_codon:yes stop_codon:yes gene_type:complete
MFNALSLIGNIAGLFKSLADWWGRRQLIEAGKREAEAEINAGQLHKIGRANRARRDSNGVRQPDFRD